MSYFIKAVIAATLLSAAACNTTAGFGEDIQSAGDTLENTANDASN